MRDEKTRKLMANIAGILDNALTAWHNTYDNYHAVPWYRLRRKWQLRRQLKLRAGTLAAVTDIYVMTGLWSQSPWIQEPAEVPSEKAEKAEKEASDAKL
jgi:hypothetical protein